jgi:hypothetical protein
MTASSSQAAACLLIDNNQPYLHQRRNKTISISSNNSSQANDNKKQIYSEQQQQQQSKFYHALVLNLLHFLIVLARTLRILYWQLVYFFCYKCEQKTGCTFFASRLPKNAQIPSHICVIFNESSDVHDDEYSLCAYIARSLASYGVSTITFYKFTPIANNVKQRLINEFCTNKDVNNNEQVKSKTIDKQLKLNFYSHSTSSHLLTDVCKKITALRPAKINQELVDLYLTEMTELSEPEMVISIGANDTLTAGFSPWHLRLSEIMQIPSPKLVNKYTLRHAFEKYNKVEKRFGK